MPKNITSATGVLCEVEYRHQKSLYFLKILVYSTRVKCNFISAHEKMIFLINWFPVGTFRGVLILR